MPSYLAPAVQTNIPEPVLLFVVYDRGVDGKGNEKVWSIHEQKELARVRARLSPYNMIREVWGLVFHNSEG